MMDNHDLVTRKRKKGIDSIFHNDDVLTEILLRLPGKALIRFTSVSKKWRSLISSDYFCRLHTLRRPKPPPPSLLIQTYRGDLLYLNHTINGKNKAIPYTLPLPTDGDRQYWIRNACNGLLLLESTIRTTEIQFEKEDRYYVLNPKDRYYVLNPTTKKSREIILPRTDDNPHVGILTLAFDPSKSPYYKIVCVTFTFDSRNESPTYRIHVYDSEFHRWELKLGDFAYPHECLFKYRGGLLWNDAVYWSSTTCYDLVKNEIKTLMPCPTILLGDDELQEFDGRLYHFVRNEDFYRQHLDHEGFAVGEWELGGDGDDGCKWVLKRHLQFPPHPLDHDDYCSGVVRFMGGGGGGEGPTCCLMTCSNGKMKSYSFVEDEYEDVDFPADYLPDQRSDYEWCDAEAFLFGEVLALV